MRALQKHFVSYCLCIAWSQAASAAIVELVPISADGAHAIVGNDITLAGSGQRLFFEIRISDWDPSLIEIWQGKIDSSGYAAGILGFITPATEPCTTNADCVAAFGAGSLCAVPPGSPVSCEAGFVDHDRGDFIFAGSLSIALVDISSTDYTYGALLFVGSPAADPGPGNSVYGGTLVIDVPFGANGIFVIDLDIANTWLKNPNDQLILPLQLIPSVVRVECQSDAECDDGNACTDDACGLFDGFCTNTPNYNTSTFCCAPSNAALTVIDDGNECTSDVCNADGSVSNQPLTPGSSCGNPSAGECDLQDTCDGAGICIANVRQAGFACGDNFDTECTDPDSCDGLGNCLANHASNVIACGSTADTECDNPDLCDGAGTCQNNHEPAGATCGALTYCDIGDRCIGGECVADQLRDCSDTLACTTDTCNEVLDQCENDIDPGSCLIEGACWADGDKNPANDCEECNPATSSTNWSPSATGDSCGDPGDTECDNPDTCSGSGTCLENYELAGAACGDPTDDDCTAPDSCNGSGTCQTHDVSDGTGCPDEGNDCTHDICDGGACLHPFKTAGVACGDPGDTDCDNPDTCDATGSCQDNSESDGAPCDDNTFCNGTDTCGSGICQHSGSPCTGPCDEGADTCCEAPIVEAVGSRYLRIAPQPPDSGPQAIYITPDCVEGVGSYAAAPTPVDIDRDGAADENVARLGGPVSVAAGFRTPAEWGELYLIGEDIVPGTTYIVRGDCGSPGNPALTAASVATSPIFGDAVGAFVDGAWELPDGNVDFDDIAATVDRFRNLPTAPPLSQTDIVGLSGNPCLPDQNVDFGDISVDVDAFRGLSFTVSTGCLEPCP